MSPTDILTQNYLKLSLDESTAERRWKWIRSVEEEREIQAAIDAEQSSLEERLALSLWLETVKRNQEWSFGPRPLNSHLPLCRGEPHPEEEFSGWYYSILNEMDKDFTREGDKWAEEVEHIHLTMDHSFGSGRDPWMRHARNFTMPLSCKVVKKGPKYWTAWADNGLGKIYIPRNIIPRWLAVQYDAPCFHVPPLSAEVIFTGFPTCRGRAFPWRAIFIEKK